MNPGEEFNRDRDADGAADHPGPLAGVRVLDLTHYVAGPFATKLLAIYGADVTKVERPGSGDPMRRIGPFVGDRPGADRSLSFLDLNVGKRGVSLDLRTATGRQLALALARRSDLVVESLRPGALTALGLGYERLREERPAIVLTSLSNFGQTGPYRDVPASEIVLYAMGHEMYGTGLPDREPLSMAPRLNLCFAGQTAALASVAGILAAEATGEGDHIDVSIMESFLSSIDRRADSLVACEYCGEKATRMPSALGVEIPPVYSRCADGWIHLSVGHRQVWDAFSEAIGEQWTRDPAYVPPVQDPEAAVRFRRDWEPWCSTRTRRELVELLQAAGVPCAPVNDTADLLDDPHLRARGFFQRVSHPEHGAVIHPGLPFRLERTPGRITSPAPSLGEHNAEVLAEIGVRRDELPELAATGVI